MGPVEGVEVSSPVGDAVGVGVVLCLVVVAWEVGRVAAGVVADHLGVFWGFI